MAPIISKVPNSRRSTVMGEGTEPNRRVQIEDDETGDIAAGETVGIPLVSPSLTNEHLFTYIRSRDGPAARSLKICSVCQRYHRRANLLPHLVPWPSGSPYVCKPSCRLSLRIKSSLASAIVLAPFHPMLEKRSV